MNSEEFRKRGKEMVDYIADYMDTIDTRRVTPNIEPGYLRDLISTEPPQKAEDWNDIMEDVEKKIMIGVTHWQHPHFHAYFPSGNSYPSILGDMLSNGLGSIGFSWAASPACTELETIVLDWMGKMVGLPEQFLAFSENSKGGGVIQGSASECVLVSLLAARAHKIKELKKQHPFVEEGVLMSKLMAYCSKEAHSCVEKAAMMAFVKLRILQPDEKQSLRGPTLAQAMEEDIAMGLIPFYVETTLGTTSCCSYDNLVEIGPLCEEYGVWLHVDGAYAGNSFICPELRGPMKGIECASSFNFNPNKFMLTNFDCSVMWVRDRFRLTQALVVDPLYLQHSYSDKSIDYRHWGIPLSRRFRALKLWFVIRSFGVEGLQKYIREHCRLAKRFESHVRKDNRFEVASPVRLGLVCFRMKGHNQINARLLSSINATGKLHMVPASLGDKYVIRFCVCAQNANDNDIDYAWQVISEFATDMQDIMEEDAINRKSRTVSENVEEMPKVSEEGDDESSEEVFQVDHQTRRSLRYKRSFFVRMVSDPKIYNPSVVRSLHSAQQTRPSANDGVHSPIFWHEEQSGNENTQVRRVRSFSQDFEKPKLIKKRNSCQNCLFILKKSEENYLSEESYHNQINRNGATFKSDEDDIQDQTLFIEPTHQTTIETTKYETASTETSILEKTKLSGNESLTPVPISLSEVSLDSVDSSQESLRSKTTPQACQNGDPTKESEDALSQSCIKTTKISKFKTKDLIKKFTALCTEEDVAKRHKETSK